MGKCERKKRLAEGQSRTEGEGRATYNDRSLFQNYLRSLERVEWERSVANPRGGLLREEDRCERDKSYENGCCAGCE